MISEDEKSQIYKSPLEKAIFTMNIKVKMREHSFFEWCYAFLLVIVLFPTFSYSQTINYRSIGTNSATLYNTGNASVTTGTTVVTFAGGASLPTNIGQGDLLTLDPSGVNEQVFILSRDNATQVTLQTNVTNTHTNVTYTITRAFNTLQAWETARQGDLVTNDLREIGVCYNDGIFTNALIIDGSTTDATRYMHLTVASGERHDGTEGTGVRIQPSTLVHGIQIMDPFTQVEWVEISDWSTNAGGSVDGININTGGTDGLVQYVIVHDDGHGSNSNSDAGGIQVDGDNLSVTVRNSLVYHIVRVGIGIHQFSNSTMTVENCTVWSTFSGGRWYLRNSFQQLIVRRNRSGR